MIIGIDCWALRLNGGGARYLFESILEYFEKNNVRNLLFLHPEAYECIQGIQKRNGILRHSIKIKINSPSDINIYAKYIDILYCPFNNISFRLLDKPIVSTLCDVQERYFPEYFSTPDLNARIENYNEILRASDRVITISNFCKETFIEIGVVNRNLIDVIYIGSQESLVQYVENPNLLKEVPDVSKFQKEEYIIYPANFYKHKNHSTLIETYRKGLDDGVKLPKLILIGVAWGGEDCPTTQIKKLGLKSHIDIVGGLKPIELAKLYSNATFVIITTQFEGFCMPAVEALYFGKKLLCSNLPILHEVTSGHATFFDQNSTDDILKCIAKELYSKDSSSNQLARVSSAKKFSWSNSFNETMKTLNKAYIDYYPKKIIDKINDFNFEFIVMYNGEDLQWLYDTVLSLIDCNLKPDYISINIINFSSISIKVIYEFLCNVTVKLSIHDHSITIPDKLLDTLKHSDFISIVSTGSVIFNSYFINILKGYDNAPNTSLIIGEVRQVHEDKERTFEKNNYFRIVEDNLLLDGQLYPEMFILTKNHIFDLESWQEFKAIRNLVVKSMAHAEYTLVRYCFATVRYRSTIFLTNQPYITPSIGFEPDINSEQMKETIDTLEKKQVFLDYVNKDIAKQVGALSVQTVREVERILIAKHTGESV